MGKRTRYGFGEVGQYRLKYHSKNTGEANSYRCGKSSDIIVLAAGEGAGKKG